MEAYWVPGVNNRGSNERWTFAEFTEVYQIEADFTATVESEFGRLIESIVSGEAAPDSFQRGLLITSGIS